MYAYGEVRNLASSLCFDTLNQDEKRRIDLGVYFCQNGASANQVFSLSKKDELRTEVLCVTARKKPGSQLYLDRCADKFSQKWKHIKGGTLKNFESNLCIDLTNVKSGEMARLEKCNMNKPDQLFEFKTYF